MEEHKDIEAKQANTPLVSERPRPFIRLVFDRERAPSRLYDLQRFAAEDEGRTEDPTERRKQEERDKGNVPKSQDLVSAVVLLGTVCMLFFTATYIYQQIIIIFTTYFKGEYSHLYNLSQSDVRNLVMSLFWETAKIVGPITFAAILMGIIANVAQVGALFTLQPIAFKPERMKPDFKKVIPNRKTMYNLAKIVVQAFFIGSVGYLVIVDDFVPMLKVNDMELRQALALFGWVSFKLLLICGVCLLIIAVPDYFYQRFEYTENLKMTISETKRERKEEDGDPMVRQRQRERGMELRQQGNMMDEVPQADVIITNPTHYAVALMYNADAGQAPIVVAKGVDHVAFLIRSVANKHGVPIQESPQLARMMYADVEIGQEIPENMYQAVSLIFAQLEKFTRRSAGLGS